MVIVLPILFSFLLLFLLRSSARGLAAAAEQTTFSGIPTLWASVHASRQEEEGARDASSPFHGKPDQQRAGHDDGWAAVVGVVLESSRTAQSILLVRKNSLASPTASVLAGGDVLAGPEQLAPAPPQRRES